MKLRIVPVVLSVVVSASVLFGGWYMYSQMAVEKPLNKVVQQYEGVKSSHIDINQEQVTLKLNLEPNTNLRGLIEHIKKEGQSAIGSRKLQLEVEDHASEALNQWWEEGMLSVAQAMDNKQYTDIETSLQKLAENNPELQVIAQIDDQNVYVSLSDGESGKFIILPRQAGSVEVWDHA